MNESRIATLNEEIENLQAVIERCEETGQDCSMEREELEWLEIELFAETM